MLARGVALLVAVAVLSACSPGTASGTAPQQVPAQQSDQVPALRPSEPFDTAALTLVGPGGEGLEVPVYVAVSQQQRSFGLMERDRLPEGTGMVFLFPDDHVGAFYMYRTRIPLSIAFFDANGVVVSVLDMDPCVEEDPAACERYDPGVAYRGALEVNQGFFDEIGLNEDWVVELPPDLPDAA